jgi:Mn2+/Fe2+ NRAMP family transporter
MLLSIVLLFILVLSSDRRLMGTLRNGSASRLLGWGTCLLVTTAVLVLLGSQPLGALGAPLPRG